MQLAVHVSVDVHGIRSGAQSTKDGKEVLTTLLLMMMSLVRKAIL